MFTVAASAFSSRNPPTIDTYIVVPPRSTPYRVEQYFDQLQAALAAAFPDLVIRLSLLNAVRDAFEPVVMPLMGKANAGMRQVPMTQEIEATKQRIAAAVLAFDPAAKLN